MDTSYYWVFLATLEPVKSGQGWGTCAGFPAGASSGILEWSSWGLEHPEPQQTTPSSSKGSLLYLKVFGVFLISLPILIPLKFPRISLNFSCLSKNSGGMELPQVRDERNEVILSFPSDPRSAPSCGDEGCPTSLWKFIPWHPGKSIFWNIPGSCRAGSTGRPEMRAGRGVWSSQSWAHP